MRQYTIGLLAGFILFLGGQTARADEIKRALFVLGIQMGGAEGVATEFVGDPTKDKPGAIALIKRNVKDSADIADVLKLPETAALKTLLADVDKTTFADMTKRLGDLRLSVQATVAKMINPGAGAYFIMGVHQSGAERVAVGARGFDRRDKPGTEALIERQLTRMADGTGTIKVTAKTVLDIQANMAKGATFADLASQLEKLRLAWQDEIGAQPGFGAAVAGGGGTGSGKVIFTQSGNLTNSDPKDSVRKDMFAKVHTVNLKAGQAVVIDLESGDGTVKPGFFDTWLRLEDSTGRVLENNDDGGLNLNSRLVFTPTQDGTFRLVVTSFAPGATGAYTLTVREKK